MSGKCETCHGSGLVPINPGGIDEGCKPCPAPDCPHTGGE